MIMVEGGHGLRCHLADRVRLATVHPSRPGRLVEHGRSEGDARRLCGVGLCLLDLGQPKLYVAVDVAVGERRLDHRLGEQLKRALEMRCRHVENDLQPRQRKIDSEARTLGFQELRELFPVVPLSALVQGSCAHGRDAFDVTTFGIERHVQHQVRRDHVLARKIEGHQLDAVAQPSAPR